MQEDNESWISQIGGYEIGVDEISFRRCTESLAIIQGIHDLNVQKECHASIKRYDSLILKDFTREYKYIMTSNI